MTRMANETSDLFDNVTSIWDSLFSSEGREQLALATADTAASFASASPVGLMVNVFQGFNASEKTGFADRFGDGFSSATGKLNDHYKQYFETMNDTYGWDAFVEASENVNQARGQLAGLGAFGAQTVSDVISGDFESDEAYDNLIKAMDWNTYADGGVSYGQAYFGSTLASAATIPTSLALRIKAAITGESYDELSERANTAAREWGVGFLATDFNLFDENDRAAYQDGLGKYITGGGDAFGQIVLDPINAIPFGGPLLKGARLLSKSKNVQTDFIRLTDGAAGKATKYDRTFQFYADNDSGVIRQHLKKNWASDNPYSLDAVSTLLGEVTDVSDVYRVFLAVEHNSGRAALELSQKYSKLALPLDSLNGGGLVNRLAASGKNTSAVIDDAAYNDVVAAHLDELSEIPFFRNLMDAGFQNADAVDGVRNAGRLLTPGGRVTETLSQKAAVFNARMLQDGVDGYAISRVSAFHPLVQVVVRPVYAGLRGTMTRSRNIIDLENSDGLAYNNFATSLADADRLSNGALSATGRRQELLDRFSAARSVEERQKVVAEANEIGFLALAKRHGIEGTPANNIWNNYVQSHNAFFWARKKRGFAVLADGSVYYDKTMQRLSDVAEVYDWRLINKAFRDDGSTLMRVADGVGNAAYTTLTALNNFFITTILLRPARLIRERLQGSLGMVASGYWKDVWFDPDIFRAPDRIAFNMGRRARRAMDRVSFRYGKSAREIDYAQESATYVKALRMSEKNKQRLQERLRARLRDPDLPPEVRVRVEEALEEIDYNIFHHGSTQSLPDVLDEGRWIPLSDNPDEARAYLFQDSPEIDVASAAGRDISADEFASQWLPNRSVSSRKAADNLAKEEAAQLEAVEKQMEAQSAADALLDDLNTNLGTDFASLSDAREYIGKGIAGSGSGTDPLTVIRTRNVKKQSFKTFATNEKQIADTELATAQSNLDQLVDDLNTEMGTSFANADEAFQFLKVALTDSKTNPSFLKRIHSSDIRLELAREYGRRTRNIEFNREGLLEANINTKLGTNFNSLDQARAFLQKLSDGGWLPAFDSTTATVRQATSKVSRADALVSQAERAANRPVDATTLDVINYRLNTNFGSLDEAEEALAKLYDDDYIQVIKDAVAKVKEESKNVQAATKRVNRASERVNKELAEIEEKTGIAFDSIEEAAEFLRGSNQAAVAVRQQLVDAIRNGDIVYELSNGAWKPVRADFANTRSIGNSRLVASKFKILPAGSKPSVDRIEIYGSKVSLADWNNLPEGLADYMGWKSPDDLKAYLDGAKWRENTDLLDWAKENEVGKIIVPDASAPSGQTILGNPAKTTRNGYSPARGRREQMAERETVEVDDSVINQAETRRDVMNRAARAQANAESTDVRINSVGDDADLLIEELRLLEEQAATLRASMGISNRRAAKMSRNSRRNDEPLRRRGQQTVRIGDEEFPGMFSGTEGEKYARQTSAAETYDNLVQSAHRLDSIDIQPSQISVLSPNDPEYFDAWANILGEWRVNGRPQPIIKRILEGESDAELIKWLRNTPEGKRFAESIGIGRKYAAIDDAAQARIDARRPGRTEALTYEEYVETIRLSVDNHLPTPGMRQRFLDGEEFFSDSLREEFADVADLLPTMEGAISITAQRQGHRLSIRRGARAVMRLVDEMPQTAMDNHPMAVAAYNKHLRLLTDQAKTASGGAKLTPDEARAIHSRAQKEAVREVRKYTYYIRNTTNATEVLRLGIPFLSAYTYTMRTIYKGLRDNPADMMWFGYQGLRGLEALPWVDSDGNPSSFLGASHAVIANITPNQAKMLRRIPFIGPAFVDGNEVRLSRRSLDVFFGGELLPSVGPIVSIPLAEYVRKNPGFYENPVGNAVLNWALPLGARDSALDFAGAPYIKATIDKWFKTDDYMRKFSQVLASEVARARHGLRDDDITEDEIRARVNAMYDAEIGNFLFLPISTRITQDYQIASQKYRSYIDEYGDEATMRFSTDYPELAQMMASVYENTYGISPTMDSVAAIQDNPELIEKIAAVSSGSGRDMLGFLINPTGYADLSVGGEFTESDRAARTWLTQNTPGDTVDSPFLRQLSPQELVDKAQAQPAWDEWRRFNNLIQSIAVQRGTTVDLDPELSGLKQAFRFGLSRENPYWAKAYNNVDADAYNDRADSLALMLSDDKWMSQNADAPVLRPIYQFLQIREYVRNQITARGFAHQEYSLAANPDLRTLYLQTVGTLKTDSPEFAEFYDRYFDGDTVM